MSRSLIRSFENALRGVLHAFGNQRNLRIQALVGIAAAGTGLWLGLSAPEWAILVLTISLVVVAEMVNTALESLADAWHPDHHPMVGVAKDVAAGAVLVAATASVAVGLLMLGPKLLALLGF